MALHVQTSMPQHNNLTRHYNAKENTRKQQNNPVVASHPVAVSRHSQAETRSQQLSSSNRSVLLTSSGDSPISNHSTHVKNGSSNSSFNQKQQGTVEKLLHSYGFIESEVQKEGHLFFHYSEVVGDVNNLVTGDFVEFNLSYDYRSSRWLAVSVTKIEAALTVSKEQFSGVVFIKAEIQENFKNCLDRSGRISYEQSGETFYIPYSTIDLQDDTSPNLVPLGKDKVTFFIATDKKTGHMWATCVKKSEPPAMSQGVVCSLKENFGFIERADLVKEIFFHYSEYAGNIAELVLGDDVEFNIQTRHNKEVATNIAKLPEGTVVFEDVSTEKRKGKIAKVIKATRKHAEPLAGAIMYESMDDNNKSTEIAYSERDISGEFTLFVGDIVDFQIAKDRRDGLIHATNVTLCEESFVVSKEKRDKGVVSSVKESYGFLQILSANCGTGVGDAQLFFHFNELYESTNTPVVVGDEIEFTIAYDPGNKSKPIAIRIRKLPKGSIRQDQVVSSQTYTGSVTQDQPSKPKKGSPGTSSSEVGLIKYSINNKETATIVYMVKDADLRYGDKVSFNLCEMKRSSDPSSKKAVNIKLLSRLGIQTGFVCSLKESYGFIETVSIDDEIFFHYSCYHGDANDLHIGDVVEYNLACRSKKVSAENVRNTTKEKLAVEVEAPILCGQVTRTISNTMSSEREAYSGLVSVESTRPGEPAVIYPFGFVSLCNKRMCPVVGTHVEFQVAKISGSIDRAVNVMICKDIVTARVDSIKGPYGFLDVEDREKKVYFSMTDIQDGSTVAVGDTVQCVVVPMPGSSKISALCIRKIKSSSNTNIAPSARPERLISKLKTQMSMTEGPKLVVARQPLPPNDKVKGFAPRVCRHGVGKASVV